MTLEEQSLEELITEESLLDLAGPGSYERGEEYYEHDAVQFLTQDGSTITAAVAGTYTYNVKLWVKRGDLRYSCSCPVGQRGDFCKHCVAVGLEWLYVREQSGGSGEKSIVTMDSVRTYLEGRDKSELIEMIVKLAVSDKSLRESLILRSAAVSPEGLDIKEFRKAIDKALIPEVNYDRYSYYEDEEDISFDEEAVDRVVDAMNVLISDGQGAAVIDLAEYALKKLEDEMESLEYESTVAEDLVEKLQEIHHSACLQAKPDPCELAEKLFDWELSDTGYMGSAVEDYADALGKEGIACYRKLAEKEWQRAVDEGEFGKYEPITHVMETLAALSGDVEALVNIKSKDLSSATTYLEIAQIYEGAGNSDLAIQWAERGLKELPGSYDQNLREFLIREYKQQGRYRDALDLSWNMFVTNPSLTRYLELKGLAEQIGEWPEWRDKALTIIRKQREGNLDSSEPGIRYWSGISDNSLLVEIFLWEGDYQEALREARAGGCRNELWLRLAGKLEESSPDDSILIYKQRVERLVDETNNTAYEQAVRLLHKLNHVMASQEQKDKFEEYVHYVRKEFYRKRNFIKLLNEAQWAG